MAPPARRSKRWGGVKEAPDATVAAAVLAGGAGTRIGGDKAARRLAGRPLLAHVLSALAPQAERLAVVARTIPDAERLVALAAPFLPQGVAGRIAAVADRPGCEGPVAALLGAADWSEAPRLLTAPVDAPFLPGDLAARLAAGLAPPARAAVAADGGLHPTILLAETAALRTLAPAGSLRATLAPLSPAAVPFPAEALANVNTAADLAGAEARIARTAARGR